MQPRSFEVEWREALELLRAELEDRVGDRKVIANEADVSYRWLTGFLAHIYPHTRVEPVLRLAQTLGMPITIHVGGVPERLQAQMLRRGLRRRPASGGAAAPLRPKRS